MQPPPPMAAVHAGHQVAGHEVAGHQAGLQMAPHHIVPLEMVPPHQMAAPPTHLAGHEVAGHQEAAGHLVVGHEVAGHQAGLQMAPHHIVPLEMVPPHQMAAPPTHLAGDEVAGHQVAGHEVAGHEVAGHQAGLQMAPHHIVPLEMVPPHQMAAPPTHPGAAAHQGAAFHPGAAAHQGAAFHPGAAAHQGVAPPEEFLWQTTDERQFVPSTPHPVYWHSSTIENKEHCKVLEIGPAHFRDLMAGSPRESPINSFHFMKVGLPVIFASSKLPQDISKTFPGLLSQTGMEGMGLELFWPTVGPFFPCGSTIRLYYQWKQFGQKHMLFITVEEEGFGRPGPSGQGDQRAVRRRKR
ncbi:uncharacterized protein LOC132062240 [Lycium ferocissimum]|uniref:uncharacterized protein LOC132062240 n=1 Tax=Lycium ferocissimum TaxID=112874 RepID=UPI0028159CE5|nr:uncharacterized protein LOC132062240 [Lycium ferocissimum]